MSPRHSHAFTLIELLIVVAIIAILAAIAVSNFLEAQTRSKTSRVLSDMRVFATALETYRVDAGAYPHFDSLYVVVGGAMYSNALTRLTTPVAYITSFPGDPFKGERVPPSWAGIINRSGNERFGYMFTSANTPTGSFPFTRPYMLGKVLEWELSSVGPDSVWAPNGFYNEAYGGQSGDPQSSLYYPSNGTVSFGNIFNTNAGFFPPR